MRRYLLPLVLMAGTALPSVASAQVREGTITVIQPRPFLRTHRVELAPTFGATVNNSILQQYAAGGSLGFGINENLTVRAGYEWYDFDGAIGGPTRAYEEVISSTASIPEVAPMTWVGSLVVDYNLLYGKFVLFNRNITFWDFYVGGGAVMAESTTEMHPGLAINFGGHVYLAKWLSFNMEYRNRTTSEEFSGGNALYHTATFSAGFGFYLPFGFEHPVHQELQ